MRGRADVTTLCQNGDSRRGMHALQVNFQRRSKWLDR